MRIAMGADFNAHALRKAVKAHLEGKGHEVVDFTGSDESPKMFLDIVPDVARKIQSGECERGILFCGTGMGMSILANKHKGIYAACCESVFAARRCRIINNANVLTMGAWIVGERMALEMVDVFMDSQFAEGLEDWRRKNVTGFYQRTVSMEEDLFK